MVLSKRGFLASAIGAVAILAGANFASAATVSYSTVGLFGASPVIASGGMTITFNPIVNNVVNTNTFASLGFFAVEGVDPVGGSFSSPFTLTVTQTLPQADSKPFGTATLSGTLNVSGSTASVVFTDPTSITLGTLPPISYTLLTSDLGGGNKGVTLNTVSGPNPGITSLQANIVATPVPLPAAAWAGLSTMGALGVFGAMKKRRTA